MPEPTDKELFEKAIDDILLEVRPIRETLSETTLEFFQKYSVPKELQDFLAANSFDRPLQIGHIYYDRTNDLARENLEEENKNCIQEGLLIIGSGLNGDPIVIDMKTKTMGFIFHDELWEDTSIKARDVHIGTGLSFGQFYWNAVSQKDNFPVDAYEAEEVYSKTNGR